MRGTLTVAPSGSLADLPPDLRGQILMRVVTVTEDITPLAVAAAARGAEAVIATRVDAAYPRQASAFAPTLTADVGIPVVGVGQVQKHALLTALSRGPVTLSLTTVQYLSPTSQNVLARRAGKKGGPPSRSRQEVMLCAHYDSVIGARGANDDGSGTVLCLELARTMRNLPTTSDLSFSLWGSEEVGLVGSRLYARGLDAAQKARLAGVFNNDMVGTSWDPAEKYWVLDYFGQSNPVNAQVLAAGERLGYRAQMSDVTPRGASDHQSFSEVGVHSGNFSWPAWRPPPCWSRSTTRPMTRLRRTSPWSDSPSPWRSRGRRHWPWPVPDALTPFSGQVGVSFAAELSREGGPRGPLRLDVVHRSVSGSSEKPVTSPDWPHALARHRHP